MNICQIEITWGTPGGHFVRWHCDKPATRLVRNGAEECQTCDDCSVPFMAGVPA